MSRYFDRTGKPIDVRTWSTLLNDNDYKRVAYTELTELFDASGVAEVGISTVWLGLDHFGTEDRPLIFETLIFGGYYEDTMWRYSSEVEALRGHERAIQLCRGTPTHDPECMYSDLTGDYRCDGTCLTHLKS